MDRKGVKKGLFIFGVIFIIVSLGQFIVSLLLLNIPLELKGENTSLLNLLFNTDIIDLSGLFLWIFIHGIIGEFLVLGILFFILQKKDQLENMRLAKYLVVMGVFLLIGCFIQLKYIIMLARTEIPFSGIDDFQSMLYTPDIAPFLAAALWISYIGVICGYLQFGLFITASGIKWVLEIEKEEEKQAQKQDSTSPTPQERE